MINYVIGFDFSQISMGINNFCAIFLHLMMFNDISEQKNSLGNLSGTNKSY